MEILRWKYKKPTHNKVEFISEFDSGILKVSRTGFIPEEGYQVDKNGFQILNLPKEAFMPLVLVGYEESQVVTKALRDLGIEAYSNDIIETSGENPEWHMQMDFFEAFEKLQPTHVIAFHPCCRLSKAGGAHWKKDWFKKEQNEALINIKRIFDLPIDFIALENPVGKINTAIRKPDQKFHPYQFGHPYTKETCLWLKGFPLLKPTETVEPIANWVKPGNVRDRKFADVPEGAGGTKKGRSKTFQNIAKAMAEQWFIKYKKDKKYYCVKPFGKPCAKQCESCKIVS